MIELIDNYEFRERNFSTKYLALWQYLCCDALRMEKPYRVTISFVKFSLFSGVFVPYNLAIFLIFEGKLEFHSSDCTKYKVRSFMNQ